MAVNNVYGSLVPRRGGIAEALGMKANPFLNFVGDNRSALLGLAAGLAGGSNWGEGLSNGFQMAAQGGMMDREAAEKLKADAKAEAALNQTSEWIKANYPQYSSLPPAEGFKLAMEAEQARLSATPGETLKPIEVNGQLVDPLTFEVLGDYRTVEGKGGNAEVSLQPTWLKDANGNWVIGQLAKDGTIVQSRLPEGMTAVDPAAVAGNKAGAVADEKTAAAARAALPSTELNYEVALKAADALLADQQGMEEQFGNILGVPQQWTGAFLGSAKANFRTQLDQLTGQAFLNIRQALKGAGAVTDYEGQRGEVAISRAQAAAERGDKKAFQQAVIEFKDAITRGLELLRLQAQGGYSAGTPGVAPPAVPAGDADIENILSGLGI